MYNPKEYWNEAGRNYKATSERKDELLNLAECVCEYLPSKERVLEVGSGNGRVYLFLRDKITEIESRFEVCDFADSFRNECRRKTGLVPVKWDGKTLPYADNEFCFVVSFSVLLHVPTSDIAKVFKEHVRVAKRYLFIATWFEKGDEWVSHGPYFRHDYFSLFAENNLRFVKVVKCSNPRRGNWLLERINA